jgi:hypothetical protein
LPDPDNIQSTNHTEDEDQEAYWEERKADKYREIVADEDGWTFSGSLYEDLFVTGDAILTHPPAPPASRSRRNG